uniref:Uncharacterized protein n=1 Tax=Magallana gigas TaxID=29159 RepID=A0A8W8M2P2_MAGGI
MQYLVRKWKRATRVGFPVMRGTVDLQQGYTLNSNSFLPLCINTQSRWNGFGPFNSHASSPLHSSVHQSPYSPSYMSSSFTQRDFLNGTSPYHSLGAASRGYNVNSNGVTNGSSPYQSVGGVFDSYYVNGNVSVHTTPTCGITAANHTSLLKTQVLEEKFSPLPLPPPQKLVTHLQHVEYSKVKVISTEIVGRSRDIVKTLLSSCPCSTLTFIGFIL